VPEKLPDDVDAEFIFGSDLKDNGGSNVIFVAFLPKALEKSKLITASNSQVVGQRTGRWCGGTLKNFVQ